MEIRRRDALLAYPRRARRVRQVARARNRHERANPVFFEAQIAVGAPARAAAGR